MNWRTGTIRVLNCIAVLTLAPGMAYSQVEPSPGAVFHPNQEVRVSNLPARAAKSPGLRATLAAGLEIVFHDPDVCCGKDSALEDAVLAADPRSLKDVSAKLEGKHVLTDGRPIMVKAGYLPGNSVFAYQIIDPLLRNRPLLLEWNLHWYVMYGAVFDETLYSTGGRDYVIRKLLLLDPRSSGSRGQAVFDRQKDDWAKVQGLLLLKAEKQ